MISTTLLLTIVAGFGVGALSGIFGVGGGFLLVPILTSLLDVSATTIVGSTSCAVLGPATTALLTKRTRVEDWRLPLVLFGGLILGVIAGAQALSVLAAKSTELVETSVLVVYAVILISLGLWTALDALLIQRGSSLPRGILTRLAIPPFLPASSHFRTSGRPVSVPIASLTAVGVGLSCGFLGISGGLVTLPLFVFGFGIRIRYAVKTSLVTVWLVSLQSTAVHATLEHVDLRLVCCLLLGGTIGARIGSVASRDWSRVTLRASFAGLLIACAIFVMVQLGLR